MEIESSSVLDFIAKNSNLYNRNVAYYYLSKPAGVFAATGLGKTTTNWFKRKNHGSDWGPPPPGGGIDMSIPG